MYRKAHGEAGRVVGPAAFDHLVTRHGAFVARGPFLECALGMFGFARTAFDLTRPQLAHNLASRIKAAFDMACAKQRSEEHTSELQSLMRISYAVFCLTKKKRKTSENPATYHTYKYMKL